MPEITNDRAVLLRYAEVALKGDNRGFFEKKLAINAQKLLQRELGKDHSVEISRKHGRIILDTDWNTDAKTALKRVFGLSSFSPMRRVTTDMEMIIQACLEEVELYVKEYGHPETFCVRSRRSDKVFPESSPEIDRQIGTRIVEKYPDWKVNLKKPHLTVGVEIRFGKSFVWTEKIAGHGGLPVGSNAPVLTLISGGLDSPVAALQILKRGSATSFVHFYGTPFVGEEVLDKIKDLVKGVNRYQPDPKPLYVVPFGKIQEKIALVTNPKMRTLLYRRMMIRIADAIAREIRAQALVTGESLGQVASQTVENIATINSVAKLPILRPLITASKEDIIEQALKWGSYDISIRPGLDCCTLFADRHPILRSSLERIEEQESLFSPAELVQEALDQVTILN